MQPVIVPSLNAPATPYKGISPKISQGHVLLYSPDPIEAGKADELEIHSLNWRLRRRTGSQRTMDTYINMVDPGIVNTGRGWNGIGPNWPQVPALFGSSQRINPSPVVRNGGNFKQGVPNTARMNQIQMRQYLAQQALAAKYGIYQGGPTAGTPLVSPI